MFGREEIKSRHMPWIMKPSLNTHLPALLLPPLPMKVPQDGVLRTIAPPSSQAASP
jgi:hypothetical protein